MFGLGLPLRSRLNSCLLQDRCPCPLASNICIFIFISLFIYIICFFCESMKGYSFRRGVLSKNPGEMSLLCYSVLEGLFG